MVLSSSLKKKDLEHLRIVQHMARIHPSDPQLAYLEEEWVNWCTTKGWSKEQKQKHIWQLRWQNKTACKAFDGKEFAHVEELKRKSQVKRKEVAKKKKELTDLKCKLENENNPDNMCILQNKIKNVLAVVQKADADEDNLFKQARERMNDLQSKTSSQVVKQSKRLRDAEGKVKEGAKKIKEGYAAIQKGTQFIHSPGDTAFETLAGVV